MENLIVQFVFLGVIESLFMEILKKKIFGDGSKTNLSARTIRIIAITIALLFAIVMTISNDLNSGWIIVFVYWMGMFSLQYVLSMKVIKKLMRKWSGV